MKFDEKRTKIQISKCFEMSEMSDCDAEYLSEELNDKIDCASETEKAEASE